MIIGKIKRKTKLFDSEKGIDIWVWFDKMDGEVVAYDNPEFRPPYYLAKKRDLKQSKENKVSSISNKPKKLTEGQKSDKDSLNVFFDQQSETMPFNCDECNKPLYAYTRFAKRCVTAHIFPKSDFKSIKTNPLNVFYLGADLLGICGHHDSWDKLGIAQRKTMNVYYLALERFELLKPHMTTAEVLEGYKYLGIPITQEILNKLK